MSDLHEDYGQWRLVSLVTALRQVLLEGPAGDGGGPVSEACPDASRRLAFLTSVMEELTDRGLDADSLIRYGLLPEVLAPIVGSIVVAQLLGDADAVAFERERVAIDVEGWRRAFGLARESVRALNGRLNRSEDEVAIKSLLFDALRDIPSVLDLGVSWVFTADIVDIFTLEPPTPNELDADIRKASVDEEVIAQYRWIVDRFSTTFIHQWATPSLHSEYRWSQGFGSPPCSVELMTERPVPQVELEREIARRAVLEPANSHDASQLITQVNRHALSFLKDGRAREAVALFEFVCHEQPENAEALNNLGFCLFPESPQRSLEYLEKANRLGYQPRVVNIYNRMCCYIANGEPRVAIREAERYWEGPESRAVPATLWVPDSDGKWTLQGVISAEEQLSKLATYAADSNSS